MKNQLVHKIIFLGFMALFMNLEKLCAEDIAPNKGLSKNPTVTLSSFLTKNTLNSTPLIIENDLEFDDSQTYQQSFSSAENTIQSFDLLFGHKSYFSKNIALPHFLLYFPIKRYLLNCIFLI